MKKKKQPQQFAVNSVLLLVQAPKEVLGAFNLKLGDVARVVDGRKVYPKLREVLIQQLAKKGQTSIEMDQNMTCVTWSQGKKPNGYFSNRRFLKIGDICSADASLLDVN